jgi:rhodanese-related sulfurtransferase
MQTINRDELQALLTQPNIILLEALNEASYRDGHLPGARLFPMASAREQARSLSPRRDAPIVVYCASETCKNSDAVAKVLGDVGYTDVRVYKGGKADWQSAGLPLEH